MGDYEFPRLKVPLRFPSVAVGQTQGLHPVGSLGTLVPDLQGWRGVQERPGLEPFSKCIRVPRHLYPVIGQTFGWCGWFLAGAHVSSIDRAGSVPIAKPIASLTQGVTVPTGSRSALVGTTSG